MADPDGVQGGSLETSLLVFKYPMKMKLFALIEAKLFHFQGIFKKSKIKSEKRTQHLYTYEPPFQKSWIRPCKYTKSQYSLTQSILVIQVSLYS